MINKINKNNCKKNTVEFELDKTQNQIILDSKQIVFLSKNGKVEINKLQVKEKSKFIIELECEKDYIKINLNQPIEECISQLRILKTTGDCFYHNKTLSNDDEFINNYITKENLQEFFSYKNNNFDSMYIINNKKGLLRSRNKLEEPEDNFKLSDIISPVKKEEYNILITTKDNKIDIKYFNIYELSPNKCHLRFKNIPLEKYDIYDLVKEKSDLEKGQVKKYIKQ